MSLVDSLSGYHVLIPRGGQPGERFSEMVREKGGIPCVIPLIDFREYPFNVSLEQPYDWIVFTSQNGVHYFSSALERLMSIQKQTPKIAAVGEKTAATLERKGLEVDFTPTIYEAEAFVRQFETVVKRDERVLLPKGNLARPTIGDELRKMGVTVEAVVVYDTFLPPNASMKVNEFLKSKGEKIIFLTSSSTVHNLFEVGPPDLTDKKIIFAVIGTVTQDTLREYGIEATVMAEHFTFEHLIDATAQYVSTLE